MTKDERERLAKLEVAVEYIPEIRADVKLLLARQSRIDGFISAAALVLTAVGAMIGAAIAAVWPKLKALL